jgi:hypothetical protein
VSAEGEHVERVEVLFNRVRPLFAGQPPGVTGAVLADLLAVWLAGHSSGHGPTASRRIREELLAAHIKLVRELIPVNEEIIRDRGKR